MMFGAKTASIEKEWQICHSFIVAIICRKINSQAVFSLSNGKN